MNSIKGGIVSLSMLGMLGGFSACGSSDSEKTTEEVEIDGFTQVVIDATSEDDYTYYDLNSGAEVDSLTLGSLGFKRTAFIMNTDVTMALANTPDGFYDENQEPIETAIKNAIPGNYEAYFQTVQADANITAFSGDSFVPAIPSSGGWYDYNLNGDHRLTAKTDSWYLIQSAKTTNELRTYAKFHVTDIVYPADTADAREIKIEAYIQKSDEFAFNTIPVTASLDVAPDTSSCYLFESESVNDCTGDWDIKVQRDGSKSYIKINTGASGSETARAMALGADNTTRENGNELPADIASLRSNYWSSDAMESLFGAYKSTYGWGQYYSTKIYPNYRTYLLKQGEKTFAIQIAGYYNPETEVSGFITLKYKEL